jgi:metal-responsive CopG/Arc/MetJ family transcriptional regulator
MQRLNERRAVVPVRFSANEIEASDAAVTKLDARSRSALIRNATQKYIQDMGGLKVIEIRSNLTVKEATREILTYLRKHKQAETFDIANDLRLDLNLTVRALRQLWEEGKVA